MSEINWKSRVKDWLKETKQSVTEDELQKMADVLKADYTAAVTADTQRTNTPRTSTAPETVKQGMDRIAIESASTAAQQDGLNAHTDRVIRVGDARTNNNIRTHGAVTDNLTNSTLAVMGGTHMDGVNAGLDHSRYAIDTEANYRSGRDDKYLAAIQGDQAIKRQALQMAGNQTTMDFISKLGLGALMLAG